MFVDTNANVCLPRATQLSRNSGIYHLVFTATNEQLDKNTPSCLSAEKQGLHDYACCLLSKGHTNNQLQSQQERVAFKVAAAVM